MVQHSVLLKIITLALLTLSRTVTAISLTESLSSLLVKNNGTETHDSELDTGTSILDDTFHQVSDLVITTTANNSSKGNATEA